MQQCRWYCLHAGKVAGAQKSLSAHSVHCWRISAVHVNLQRKHTYRLSVSTFRNGAEERVSYASFPGSNPLLYSKSKFDVAVAKQTERPHQGGGIDHWWRTRHRTTPGQRVCQAWGQKGKSITCCTYLSSFHSFQISTLLTTRLNYFLSNLFWSYIKLYFQLLSKPPPHPSPGSLVSLASPAPRVLLFQCSIKAGITTSK